MPITTAIFAIFIAVCVVFSPAASHAQPSAAPIGPPFAHGQVVVAGSPASLDRTSRVIKYLPHANLTVVATESGKEWGQVMRHRAQGRRAGLNYLATAFATVNDPYYPLQWHMTAVQAEPAWDITRGFGITVAVLDTGLATASAVGDGINCVVAPMDIVNNDTAPDDGDGHGTHVAGTVAQRTNNGIGVAGLAHEACIMPVKVLDDTGSGNFADIADGIYYAVDQGARVINMSLGTNARYKIKTDPIMDAALDHALANNVTVVCAAGNDGVKSNVSYPAIAPTTIAVGATDYMNSIPRYSNRGQGLDLVAPGGDTTKDLNGDGYGDGVLQETLINGAWGYYFFAGTSMASPHVAAVAAMLLSIDSSLTPAEILTRLTTTALDVDEPGYDKNAGHGLVQAYSVLTAENTCVDSDADGWSTCDNDCDDSDSSVNPNAAEICGDLIDNNCNGMVDDGCPPPGCTDIDNDGWCVEDGDCDDTNAVVYPGHPDKGGRWGKDGLDNDCNGIIDG